MSTKLIGFIYKHFFELPRLPSTWVALFALLPYQYLGNGALSISDSPQVWVQWLFLHFSHLFWFVLCLCWYILVFCLLSLRLPDTTLTIWRLDLPFVSDHFPVTLSEEALKDIKWMCETRMCQSTVQKGVKALFQWLLTWVKRKLNLIKNHSTDFWNRAQEVERSWRRPKRSIACLCTTTHF